MQKIYIPLLFTGLILSSILLHSCFAIQRGDEYKALAPGEWRGLFVFGEGESAEKVPVNFIVKQNSKKQPDIFFKNGTELVPSDSISVWGDTIYAFYNQKQQYLRLIYEPGLIQGFFYDTNKKNYPVEFYAKFGPKHRFPDLRIKPNYAIEGNWAMDILKENGELSFYSLKLKVKANDIQAELQSTKESQAQKLEGCIQGKQIFLSAFNGKEIIYLKGELKDSITMGKGTIRFNMEEMAFSAKKQVIEQ